VTRGRFPQRAGLPGLNGGGTAAAVPPVGYSNWPLYPPSATHGITGPPKSARHEALVPPRLKSLTMRGSLQQQPWASNYMSQAMSQTIPKTYKKTNSVSTTYC